MSHSESIANEKKKVDLEKPLRIISISDSGDEFALEEDNLNAIFEAAAKINPEKVVIVSVVGDFRSGKSLFLDVLLRYLRYTEKTGKVPSSPKDQNLPDWLSDAGSLQDGKDGGTPGFAWRSGKERTTTGIWMYGKPFSRTLPGTKEKVPVILMDTQGLFDRQTSKDLTAAIFGLSTLISSFQVYNVVKQIQEDKLQQLHFFTEFSKVALKEFERAQNKPKSEVKGQSPRPFQSLQFLVRDWQNFDDETDLEGCLASMPAYCAEAMTMNVDDSGTREEIKNSFDQLSAFMLPHPGHEMTKTNYTGGLGDIRREFIALVDRYARNLFEKDIVVKKVSGITVGPSSLKNYIKEYSRVFRSGKLPKATTLVQAIAITTNINAKEEALEVYKHEMAAAIDGKFLGESEFRAAAEKAKTKAFTKFNEAPLFGSEEMQSVVRTELQSAVIESYKSFSDKNRFNMQAGLERYIIPILAAVIAFLLDWVSDFICDSWLDACVELSKFFSLIYFITALVVGWELYRIYQKQGSVAVGVAGMALGEATMRKVHDLQDRYKHHTQKPKSD